MKKAILLLVLFVAHFVSISAQTYKWKELGGKGINSICPLYAHSSEVKSICSDGLGNIYAVGNFEDSNYASYTAKWNGSSWKHLGDNKIYGNSVCADKKGNVYVAEGFNNDSGKDIVYKWDGTKWTELYTTLELNGVNIVCNDKAVYSVAEKTTSDYEVVKFDGKKWGEVGSLKANGRVNAICLDTFGNIYATGEFTDAKGAYYTAKWDGKSWTELGDTTHTMKTNLSALSLCTDPAGNVYATGYFTNTDGYYYITKWDGKSWSELGAPKNTLDANSMIFTLCSDPAGNIYAGGNFEDANFDITVAKWNGKSWFSLGPISDFYTPAAQVHSICTDSKGNLFAGGDFRDDSQNCYVAEYSIVTGIENIDFSNNDLKIYPNPSTSKLYFTNKKSGTASAVISILDLSGRIIFRKQASSIENAIDVSSFPSGVYLFRYQDADSIWNTKFVKE